MSDIRDKSNEKGEMFSISTPSSTLNNHGSVLGPSRSDKLLVPGKVIASNNIVQGAMSRSIDPEELSGKTDVVQVSVLMNQLGTIQLDTSSERVWPDNVHWVRAIRLSNDCHSYNIQLKLHPSQRIFNASMKNSSLQLILQAVRPIAAGQELLLWFSEEILAMLQMAFLTPANIQGQKEYVCLKCCSLYEFPNPLKLHITLACGRSHPIILWERLSTILTDKIVSSPPRQDVFDFKIAPASSALRQKIAMDLTVTNTGAKNCTGNKMIHRSFSDSAFKPFRREEENGGTTELKTVTEEMICWPLTGSISTLSSSGNLKENEAEIETLVSSLGKTKQGHLCIYCGKCYSRKYGLKIHIRTHTGYKPLECKFCKRPFGDPSNLNKHVRLHDEGNTPYRCNLCGKVLVRRRDLERHLKSRHLPETNPDLNLLPSDVSHEEDGDSREELKSPKMEIE